MADFKHMAAITLKEEGGLSRAKTDTASKFPSPYPHPDKTGKVYKDWHTNRGITYSTFKIASKALGFQDNAENFINMSDAIWYKIAKQLYWDSMRLDEVKSQALANLLYSWAWASGYGWKKRTTAYINTKGIPWKGDIKSFPDSINKVIDKVGEKKVSDDLFNQYREFYKSLNQPANEKSWIDRANRLQEFSNTFLSAVSKNKGSIAGVIFVAGSLTFLYFMTK